jgi:hypothetical protein
VHVLAWLPDATIDELIRTAPEGTRFVFNKKGVEADDAARWLDQMRAVPAL